MFFFETLAFVLCWPLLWWLGGVLSKEARTAQPKPPEDPVRGDNVVDLAEWRRRHGGSTLSAPVPGPRSALNVVPLRRTKSGRSHL